MKKLILLSLIALGIVFASCATPGLIGNGGIKPKTNYVKSNVGNADKAKVEPVTSEKVRKYSLNEPNSKGLINNGKYKQPKKTSPKKKVGTIAIKRRYINPDALAQK